MGCDIHAYIEKYSDLDSVMDPSAAYVDCVAHNIGLGRDYTLFGLIANVRSMVSAPRSAKGIPTQPALSYEVANEYYLSISASPVPSFVGKNVISREQAEQYIEQYGLTYANKEQTKIQYPHWHSATHLTLEEMMSVRKDYLIEVISYENELSGKSRKQMLDFIKPKTPESLMRYSFPGSDSPVLYASIKMMQAIEQSSEHGDLKTRFVCWFDS